MVKVAAVQSRCGPDPERNIGLALGLAASAVQDGAKVICLEELFATEFFPVRWDSQSLRLANELSDTLMERCRAFAKSAGVWLLAPYSEPGCGTALGQSYNSVGVFDSHGSRVATYRKLHVPLTATNLERRYFSPGDLGPLLLDVDGLKLGVGICYDRHFPELGRHYALRGADLIVYCASSLATLAREGNDGNGLGWQATYIARAVETGCYVMVASRPGTEGHARFVGRSLIVAPDGMVTEQLNSEESGYLLAEVDSAVVRARRVAWPILEDLRPEFNSVVGP